MEAAWSAARLWGSTTTRAGASGSTALRITSTAWSASPSRWRWNTRSPATAGDPTTPIWSSSSRRWWSGPRWGSASSTARVRAFWAATQAAVSSLSPSSSHR